jgi:glucosamine 6-phosphate synthetase-like amidotransferase/phosphosugar isomerase protein
VVAIYPDGITHGVMLSNIKGIKARNAPVVALGESQDIELRDIVDIFIPITSRGLIYKILSVTAILQLLAYHTAKELECEI